MPFHAGVRLGPCEIIAPLGAGGMGEVYRARDPRLGRDVSIKLLPTGLSAEAGTLMARPAGGRFSAYPANQFTSQLFMVEGAPWRVIREVLCLARNQVSPPEDSRPRAT